MEERIPDHETPARPAPHDAEGGTGGAPVDGHAVDLAHLQALSLEHPPLEVDADRPVATWLGVSIAMLADLATAAQTVELHLRLLDGGRVNPRLSGRAQLREQAAAQVRLLGEALRADHDCAPQEAADLETLTRRVARNAFAADGIVAGNPERSAGALAGAIARDVGTGVARPDLQRTCTAVALGHALALFILAEEPAPD